MSVQGWPAAETSFAELEQFFANCRNVGGLGVKRFPECDGHRVGDSLWKLCEKSSALEREDGSPELIEPNRNDLRVGVPRDQFITALQSQQRSRAFQLALGENADDFAIGDFFSSGANRSVRMADIDRDAPERTQDWVQNRSVIILLVNDVANWTGTGELQDKGVHPGDMVGHNKKPAAGQIFQTERSDAIQGTNQQSTKEIEGALGA